MATSPSPLHLGETSAKAHVEAIFPLATVNEASSTTRTINKVRLLPAWLDRGARKLLGDQKDPCPDNVEAIVALIRATDRAELRDQGLRGYARYLAQYPAHRMNAQVFELYRDLMRERPVQVEVPA